MLRERLIAYRKENRLTQAELANQIHVSRQTIPHWETGQSTPDIQSLVFLCDLYNITIDELLDDKLVAMQAKAILKQSRQLALGIGIAIMAAYASLLSSRWLLFTYAMMLTTAFSTIGVMLCLTLIKITKPFRLSTCQSLIHYLITGQIPVGRRPKISGQQLLFLAGLGICLGLVLTFSPGIAYLGWTI
ncbi:helix-turn-helix transcriptional regulator [Lentilactobacillus raoultii]|uniref:Helix-turn-helix transcriptional regulator n=1 Tax=Lentilactobacillus raoultii TaxID=1987503 RepID=A0ABW3PJR5_9LACO|nr:helix-turn-helix transcriptional regulator [Lentilactobacillus raoultii]